MSKANKDLDLHRENRTMSPFGSFFPELDHLAERFFGSHLFHSALSTRAPKMDFKENDDAYMLTAELPGIPEENIDVNVSGNILTIQGEERKNQDADHRSYRRFYQSLTLPHHIDSAKLEAHYENGCLEVWIPKSEASKSRKVELKSGQGGFSKRFRGEEKEAKTPPPAQERH